MKAVTGATGFLGSHLVCHLLKKGHRVLALKRPSSSLKQFEYIASSYFTGNEYKAMLEWADADVLDTESLEQNFGRADEVYHCAAVVSFEKKDRDRLMQINVEGTANVVNACLEKGVKALCAVSSIAALGREKPGDKISENTRWADSGHNSNYAISKYKAELELWRGVEEGLNTVIVNPGVILGVGDWSQGSCKLFDLAWKQVPFYTHGVNGYVDVQDVARAMIMLMEKKKYGERYILVSHNLEMKKFLDTAADLLGKKRPAIGATKFLAGLAWRVDGIRSKLTGKKQTITRETAHASLNKFYYDSGKIEREGFSFAPIEQTIQYICKALKTYHT